MGLISISKTRFAIILYAIVSVITCLPAIKVLVKDEIVDTSKPDSALAFLRNAAAVALYELQLQQLCAILTPIAHSIKCLESTQSTAADVYLFWLAIMATLNEVFRVNEIGLSATVTQQIRGIVNFRYSEMIDGPGKEVYLVAFFLDPREYFRFDFPVHDIDFRCTRQAILRRGSGRRSLPIRSLRQRSPSHEGVPSSPALHCLSHRLTPMTSSACLIRHTPRFASISPKFSRTRSQPPLMIRTRAPEPPYLRIMTMPRPLLTPIGPSLLRIHIKSIHSSELAIHRRKSIGKASGTVPKLR